MGRYARTFVQAYGNVAAVMVDNTNGFMPFNNGNYHVGMCLVMIKAVSTEVHLSQIISDQ